MNERILNSPEARYRLMRLERERERKAKADRDRLLGLDGAKIADVLINGGGESPLPSGNGTINVKLTADDSKFREALMQRSIRAKPADTPDWQKFKPYKREQH